jgi:hypothetical protein
LGSQAHDGRLHVRRPAKKQIIGFIYPIDKINEELSLTNVEKGFKFKELKDKIMQDVHDYWDEFVEVHRIEKDESIKDSQRVSEWATTNLEGLSRPRPAKKP